MAENPTTRRRCFLLKPENWKIFPAWVGALLWTASFPAAAQTPEFIARAEGDANGDHWLTFPTVPGWHYVVEKSTDLAAFNVDPAGYFYGDGDDKRLFLYHAEPSGAPVEGKAFRALHFHVHCYLAVTEAGQAPRVRVEKSGGWSQLLNTPFPRKNDLSFVTWEDAEFRCQLMVTTQVHPAGEADPVTPPPPESMPAEDAAEWQLFQDHLAEITGAITRPPGIPVPPEADPPEPGTEAPPAAVRAFYRVTAAAIDSNLNTLPDWWELASQFDPFATSDMTGFADPLADPDADGLSDAQELAAGTNGKVADSDRDGSPDLVDPSPKDPSLYGPRLQLARRHAQYGFATAGSILGSASWDENLYRSENQANPLPPPVIGGWLEGTDDNGTFRFPFPQALTAAPSQDPALRPPLKPGVTFSGFFSSMQVTGGIAEEAVLYQGRVFLARNPPAHPIVPPSAFRKSIFTLNRRTDFPADPASQWDITAVGAQVLEIPAGAVLSSNFVDLLPNFTAANQIVQASAREPDLREHETETGFDNFERLHGEHALKRPVLMVPGEPRTARAKWYGELGNSLLLEVKDAPPEIKSAPADTAGSDAVHLSVWAENPVASKNLNAYLAVVNNQGNARVLDLAILPKITVKVKVWDITIENDDHDNAAIPPGRGEPNAVCIRKKSSVLMSTERGDDVAIAGEITTGPNGICDTPVAKDNGVDLDEQVIRVGEGKQNAVFITPGPNGKLNTPPNNRPQANESKVVGDDTIVGETLTTGPNGIRETPVTNYHAVNFPVPTNLNIKACLDDIYLKQANVEFDVTFGSADVQLDLQSQGPWDYTAGHPVHPLLGVNGYFDFFTSGQASTEEQALHRAAFDPSVHVNVYFIPGGLGLAGLNHSDTAPNFNLLGQRRHFDNDQDVRIVYITTGGVASTKPPEEHITHLLWCVSHEIGHCGGLEHPRHRVGYQKGVGGIYAAGDIGVPLLSEAMDRRRLMFPESEVLSTKNPHTSISVGSGFPPNPRPYALLITQEWITFRDKIRPGEPDE